MKSYDAINSGSITTRCGNCGRLIRAHAEETERVSIPLRFLLYPIPIVSYVLMAETVKRFCCLPCKEEYEARHPNAWKSTFWGVHGVLLLLLGLFIIAYVVLVMDGEAPSPMQIWENASTQLKDIKNNQ